MGKRKNGEGTWGIKKIKGVDYKYYRDADQKYTYGKTEKEIKEKLKKKKKCDVSNKMIFSKYLSWYYDNVHRNSVEKTTLETYKRNVKIITNSKYYDMGSIRMDSFTKKNNPILKYINAITPHYSRNTILRQYSTISVAVRYAEDNELMPIGLLRNIKMPTESNVGVKVKVIPFLNKKTADLLYNELDSKYANGAQKYGFYAWVVILFIHTGIRFGEMRALKWEDVNFDDKTLTVDESMATIQEEDGNYITYIKSTKNKSSNRIIPLNDIAIEMLTKIKGVSHKTKNSDFVCIYHKTGHALSQQFLTNTINRMLRNVKSDVKKCNIHALRHTFGSILFDKGADLKTISELMGHADIQTTANIYIGVTEQKLQDTVKLLV